MSDKIANAAQDQIECERRKVSRTYWIYLTLI